MLYRKNYVRTHNHKLKKSFIKSNIFTTTKHSQSLQKILILVPWKWSLLLFRDTNKEFYTFYLYSTEYYFRFSIAFTKMQLTYCPNTNVVTFKSTHINALSTTWSSMVNNLLYLLTSFFFIKLKFKGKGYYIYKNSRNTIAPQFGYYHRIYIYSFFNKVKFLSKTKVLLFGLVKSDILLASHKLKQKRSINIFTGRGVRFARQIIYKKTGKVSSYR